MTYHRVYANIKGVMKNMNNLSNNKNNQDVHHYDADGTPVYTREQIKEHWKDIGKKVGALALTAVTVFGVYNMVSHNDQPKQTETIQLQPGQTRWEIAEQIAKDSPNNQDHNPFNDITTGDVLDQINHDNPNNGVDQAGESLEVPKM